MSRKRKRRHSSENGTEPETRVADQVTKVQPGASEPEDERVDGLGDRVQARIDADIGLDHSLPPNMLRSIGTFALVVGLTGLALTVPADWLTWSRVLSASAGAFVAWVAVTATLGEGNCETIWFTGGLLFVLTLLKWITGFPALIGPGPGGVFLVGSATAYAVAVLAWAGSRSGPAALLAREVEFVKLAEPFQDELADLRAGVRDAQVPVVLQCRRCGVVFSFLADRIILSSISIDTLKGPNRAWMDINRCGANFECRIEEPATCPRCETTDDYVFAEHPEITLRSALEAEKAGPSSRGAISALVHAHMTFRGDGPPAPVLERWAQLREAVEVDKDAVAPRLELARLYRWLKLGGLAREHCEHVLDFDQKCVPAWTLMAELMRDRGEEEAAHMLITDAVLGEGDAIRKLMEHPELQAALMRHARGRRGRRRR